MFSLVLTHMHTHAACVCVCLYVCVHDNRLFIAIIYWPEGVGGGREGRIRREGSNVA